MKFKVSRRTDVALQALRIAAAQSGTIPGSTLATETGTSQAYLSQCLAPVITAGWLVSRTGPDGGYLATESAHEVSLLQVIEAIEGPMADRTCVLDDRVCGSDEPCTLHPFWAGARQVFMESLHQVKAID